MAVPHISVCVCTFRRPALLQKLLHELESQWTDGLFTYDVVVADNDAAISADAPVRAFAARSPLRVTYCVEPERNIARARNRALAHATGDLVAFIDDDEFPVRDWLCQLFQAWTAHRAQAVLGPVMPHFDHEPPAWVRRGRFFDRPRHATGHPVAWQEARSGNVLLDAGAVKLLDPPFRSEFATAGEDVDFFRRLADRGCAFVWCDEAVAYELVPADRCTRRYLLRRAALRGSNFPKHPAQRVRNVVKSVVAVPCYTLALPVLAIGGHHVFLKYLIKLFDHTTRLLAFAGLPVVTERHT